MKPELGHNPEDKDSSDSDAKDSHGGLLADSNADLVPIEPDGCILFVLTVIMIQTDCFVVWNNKWGSFVSRSIIQPLVHLHKVFRQSLFSSTDKRKKKDNDGD